MKVHSTSICTHTCIQHKKHTYIYIDTLYIHTHMHTIYTYTDDYMYTCIYIHYDNIHTQDNTLSIEATGWLAIITNI